MCKELDLVFVKLCATFTPLVSMYLPTANCVDQLMPFLTLPWCASLLQSSGGFVPFRTNGVAQSDKSRETILLGACAASQQLPQNPDLPADVFTACLTTPIKVMREKGGGAQGGTGRCSKADTWAALAFIRIHCSILVFVNFVGGGTGWAASLACGDSSIKVGFVHCG